MHLWCFVLACKKIWVLDTSCCPDHCFRSRGVCRSTHKDTHTHKKKTSAASRGFVVSSCWLPFPNARHNKLPSCIFFALCPFHRFFFALCPSHRFFFTLCRSHRFFFALCLSHCFFLHFARSIAFFLHFAGHIAFFLHFVCHIAFFLQFGGCFVFFLQSSVPIAFFLQREDWRSQRCFFFARRICIIRLLQFRLHFSLHFCIYFAFFRFFPYFFTLWASSCKKNAMGKTHWFPLLFFCASVLGDVPGCIFRNPACEPIVGSHSLSQLCALPSSGGGVCDWRFSLEDSCQARTQQCTSYK